MGNELFSILIVPIVLVCALAAIWFWFPLAQDAHAAGRTHKSAYVSLCVGFAVSMLCVALLTYFESAANFSSLIEKGRYTEAQRSEYMPGRILMQAVLNLVFVLPAISFAVIPMTVKVAKANRLTLRLIGFRTLVAWLTLTLIGWAAFLHNVSPRALLVFALATLIPVVISAVPIPVAALVSRRRWDSKTA